MRATLWLIGLFAAAAAIALFAGHNPGTVTLYWPPYRVDMSLNLVLLLMMAFIIVVVLAVRALSGLVDLPKQARQWRQQQRERVMHTALLDGISQLVAGRYLRAQRSAEAALSQEQSLSTSDQAVPHANRVRTLAHLLMAESAQALQNQALRNEHLRLAEQAARSTGMSAEALEGVQLRTARWALDDREPRRSLSLLAELPHGVSRRTVALRLRLRAARLAGDTQAALETARLLVKHHAFYADGARLLLRGLGGEVIQATHDDAQLQRAWASLTAQEQQMPELAIQAAQRLLELDGPVRVAHVWLLPVWEAFEKNPVAYARELGGKSFTRLVRALETVLPAQDIEWLGRVEKLQRGAGQPLPELSYLVGVACQHRQLWGKARQMLELAAGQLTDADLRRSCWRHLAELAEQRGDDAARAEAWRQAASID